MTVSGAKVCIADEKSPVKVRRKNAPVLDLRRISVLGGLSGRLIGHTGDQMPWSRGTDCGIIDDVACRSANDNVKWQILGRDDTGF